ncbi:DedA family protein [Roseomonas sp. E05]|uniref:DedA family protein n=1 Tax=Roseomonas sp. E05 TaxID=3046310 RepID=UPI0024BB1FB5|nr:DedA family protein [Roseomonas sp. E05]MDJ0391510.1 DedA family protein [Roseomonas sp. E05]
MAEFWAEWGSLAYLAAAAWAFFEGETFVLLAAAAGRATSLINPWALMFSVWIGSFLGDQLWFTLGRRYGIRALRRIPGGEKRIGSALRFLERYGTLFVLSFRFVYGVRNVASAACGIAGMPHPRFAALNFIAAGLWAASFTAAGWFAVAWLGEEGTSYALGGIGAVVVLYLAVRLVQYWRRPAVQRQEERPPVLRTQELPPPPERKPSLNRIAV